MAQDYQQDRSRDWSIVGLILFVFGSIALAVPCLKLAMDGLFSLF